MALPNDSVQQAEGAGTTLATNLISSKEYAVIQFADPDGHIYGTRQAYLLYQTPRAATTTVTDYFDLFNPTGTGKTVRIGGIYPVIAHVGTGNATVTTWGWSVIRTSAAGTGGTAFTYAPAAPSTTQGDISISPIDSTAGTVNAVLTGRGVPTGGATAAQFLFSFQVSAIVTNPAANLIQGINMVPQIPDYQVIELQENQGIKIRQDTNVSSGTTNAARFGFIMAFSFA